MSMYSSYTPEDFHNDEDIFGKFLTKNYYTTAGYELPTLFSLRRLIKFSDWCRYLLKCLYHSVTTNRNSLGAHSQGVCVWGGE